MLRSISPGRTTPRSTRSITVRDHLQPMIVSTIRPTYRGATGGRNFLLFTFHRSAPFCSHPTELCLLVRTPHLPESVSTGSEFERSRPMREFVGRKLIVVGGTSGIGRMVVRLFLERGGSAVVIGRRDDNVAAAVKELGE